MRLSLSTQATRFWPLGLLGLLGVTLVTGGCVVETHDDSDYCHSCGGSGGSAGSGPAPESIVRATIDTDQTLQTQLGNGVGVFIEYAAGGSWHVFTACDTNLSQQACTFNVVVTLPSDATYSNIRGEALESSDQIYQYPDGLELAVSTSTDSDGVYFDAPAGTTTRFEVYLDGSPEARYTYWIGGGAVHSGAPSNPVDLKPSAP